MKPRFRINSEIDEHVWADWMVERQLGRQSWRQFFRALHQREKIHRDVIRALMAQVQDLRDRQARP